jgi:hypothetical protein
VNQRICCSFHGLGPLTCSDSELTSGTKNSFRYTCRIPWTGDRPIARPVPTQYSTTQRNEVIHPALRGIETPDPSFKSCPRQ